MIRHRLANIVRRTPNVEYRPICFGLQMRPAVIDNTGSNGRQAGRGATSLRASGYDRAGVRQSFGRSASSIRRVSDAGAYPSTNANWRIPSIESDAEGPVRGIGLVPRLKAHLTTKKPKETVRGRDRFVAIPS